MTLVTVSIGMPPALHLHLALKNFERFSLMEKKFLATAISEQILKKKENLVKKRKKVNLVKKRKGKKFRKKKEKKENFVKKKIKKLLCLFRSKET